MKLNQSNRIQKKTQQKDLSYPNIHHVKEQPLNITIEIKKTFFNQDLGNKMGFKIKKRKQGKYKEKHKIQEVLEPISCKIRSFIIMSAQKPQEREST